MATADDFEALAANAEKVNTDLKASAKELEDAVTALRNSPGDPAAQAKYDDALARLQAVTGDHGNLVQELHNAAQTPTPPPPPPPAP